MGEKEALKINEQRTAIWQVKAHEQWVKTVLISDILEPNARICELYCGNGLDIGKWARGKIAHFLGVDPIESSLEEAKDRWNQKKQPFPAEFILSDPSDNEVKSKEEEKFDVVCCFDGLQRSFESEEKCRTFLENVSKNLKSGGFFFGLVPDSSAIWYRAHHVVSNKPAVKGELYSIEFPNDDFNFFGTSYTFRTEGAEEQKEFLVHFPTLIKMAAEYDLTMLEMTNLFEFYEENRKNYADRLKELRVLNKQQKIEPGQRELICKTFEFYDLFPLKTFKKVYIQISCFKKRKRNKRRAPQAKKKKRERYFQCFCLFRITLGFFGFIVSSLIIFVDF